MNIICTSLRGQYRCLASHTHTHTHKHTHTHTHNLLNLRALIIVNTVHIAPCSNKIIANCITLFFFFHWHYSPLWAFACRTRSFHFFLSVTNSLHHLYLYPAFPFVRLSKTISFLLCGVVSPTPNPKPGGPGYPFLSGSSPLTCLAWEALPVAHATASIALGIMWPHKPNNYVKVRIPSGGTLLYWRILINHP
jgi:hypothetical protein